MVPVANEQFRLWIGCGHFDNPGDGPPLGDPESVIRPKLVEMAPFLSGPNTHPASFFEDEPAHFHNRHHDRPLRYSSNQMSGTRGI